MDNYFYYDEDQCCFLPVSYNRKDILIHYTSVFICSGSIISAILISFLASWVATPAEMVLQKENRQLFSELTETGNELEQLDRELEEISRSDNELYRAMLGVEPIPEDERMAGVGGSDIYSDYEAFQEETSELLKWTAKTAENLKRRVHIQKNSFEKIRDYYRENREKMRKLPALKPLNGIVISPFGMREHPVLGYDQKHYGMDFRARVGTPVYATGDGTVTFASRRGYFGLLVEIEHDNGYKTKYAHLSQLAEGIEAGASVQRGQIIAKSGNSGRTSGPHLHYEVHRNGEPVDPVNYIFDDLSPVEYREYRGMAEGSAR